MNDLMDRLHRLGDAQPTTDETVRRDLVRGRGAARRRALRVGTAGFTVAAIAGVGVAIAVTADPQPADQPSATGPSASGPPASGPSATGPSGPTSAPSDSGSTSTERTKLVAYTGEQEPGFVVTKVPEGFVIEGASPYNLNVARPDNLTGIDSFEDKLVVMLESQSATGTPQGSPIKAGSLDGWLDSVEGGTQVLTYDDGDRRVVIQAWKTLGLTDEQVIEFARGVTVTADAKAGLG